MFSPLEYLKAVNSSCTTYKLSTSRPTYSSARKYLTLIFNIKMLCLASTGALDILRALGNSCKHQSTEEYRFPDNPGHMNNEDPDFPDHCIGFRNIPDVINCEAGGYQHMQRLYVPARIRKFQPDGN